MIEVKTTLGADNVLRVDETGGITERRDMGRVSQRTAWHDELDKLYAHWYAEQRFPPSRWRAADWSTFEETVTDDRELAHLTSRQRAWLDAYARLWNATVR